MKLIFVSIATLAIAGCAAYEPIPKGYSGPRAEVRDGAIDEGRTKAQLFALTEIDGNGVANSFSASERASRGKGLFLTQVVITRELPAKPMRVTLRASHVTGAPIHALASQLAGTFFSVQGSVDFSPQPEGRYVVKGELKKEGSSVWIEDASTGQVVTEKVTGK